MFREDGWWVGEWVIVSSEWEFLGFILGVFFVVTYGVYVISLVFVFFFKVYYFYDILRSEWEVVLSSVDIRCGEIYVYRVYIYRGVGLLVLWFDFS